MAHAAQDHAEVRTPRLAAFFLDKSWRLLQYRFWKTPSICSTSPASLLAFLFSEGYPDFQSPMLSTAMEIEPIARWEGS